MYRFAIIVTLLTACGDVSPEAVPAKCNASIPVDMTTHLGSVVVECQLICPGVCIYEGRTYPCEGSGE